ncbi:mhr1p [Saccharomyces arboricola H-6]|uniref:Large ribosomal subunit protein mL67 n=1 Tax=Saccharomyces arboricola (strain H-6 / AS 2.3317 / CBS 10644) TaxID=1160507 RepID=J8PY39_SACAR|nr:mhr1p [Saccharomyces arboricola H-6]
MKINHSISRFRPASWFEKTKIIPPQVYIFRNLEYGQVIYSQFPNFSQKQVDKLFTRPNWSNRKPSLRRDIWKCMCVVNLQNYQQSVQLYQNLCRLRYLRDVAQRKESDKLRKKDSNGHVWFSGQYRPTYCQEAVADLRESLLKVFDSSAQAAEKQAAPVKKPSIYWEDPWRMGDKNKYWTYSVFEDLGLEHKLIERLGNTAREESVILKELAKLQSQPTDHSEGSSQ